jgi:retron-type reverse transcriptase
MTFNDITSVENLLLAWEEFLKGKRKRKDVQEFQMSLMDNVLDLHRDLINKTYQHGPYEAFNISDPKPRNIHKATVRDRLLHHAIYRILYPVYDQTFIAHSYSCRKDKGTHKALDTFTAFVRRVSHNHTKTVWVLKCDIRKFFTSIDHAILFKILEQRITDPELCWLLKEVVGSFETAPNKGLPLGNLTSQLLVNIYMNEFDQYVKRELKSKYYIRYADDFVFFSRDPKELVEIVRLIVLFLRVKLKLGLHPRKVSIITVASGVDFLGWVHFPYHKTLRTVTKRRIFKRLQKQDVPEATVQSYLGLLGHGNTNKLQKKMSQLLLNVVDKKRQFLAN